MEIIYNHPFLTTRFIGWVSFGLSAVLSATKLKN